MGDGKERLAAARLLLRCAAHVSTRPTMPVGQLHGNAGLPPDRSTCRRNRHSPGTWVYMGTGTWYLGQPIPPWGEGSLSKKNPVYWSITFEKLVGHSPGGGDHIAMGRNGEKSVDVDRFFLKRKFPAPAMLDAPLLPVRPHSSPWGRGIQIQTPVSGRSGFGHSNDQGP